MMGSSLENNLNKLVSFCLKSKFTSVFRSLWIFNQLVLFFKQGPRRRLGVLARKTLGFFLERVIAFAKRTPSLKLKVIRISRTLGIHGALLRLKNKVQNVKLTEASEFLHRITSSYPDWSEAFDTPSVEDLEWLESSRTNLNEVTLICFFDEQSASNAVDVAHCLAKSVGKEWKAIFYFTKQVANIDALINKVLLVSNAQDRISFSLVHPEGIGDIVILVDGNVLPRMHSIRVFCDSLEKSSDQSLSYSDEDFIGRDRVITAPWFKPEFSPLLLEQGVLLGGMVAIKDSKLNIPAILNSIDSSNSLSQFICDYTKKLKRENIVHIAHVLYHNRKPISPSPLKFQLPKSSLPTVGIVIPTKDRWDLLGPCLESLFRSDWDPNRLEIIVVDNGSTDKMTLNNLQLLYEQQKIVLIHDSDIFNWSRLNNLAARKSDSDLLVFLNNDTLVDDPSWIKKMAVHAIRPEVGAVGCKLLFADRTVQHGGVVAGIHGVAGHAHLFLKENEGGYQNLANITHEVSAVTGACLMVKRQVFESVGGFDENFRVAFNDVIFCFNLVKKGYFNIYVADPLLLHFESKSRGYDDTKEKIALNRQETSKAWLVHPEIMRNDPFYSPNLSLYSIYDLSFAPRKKPFWKKDQNRKQKVLILSITHAIGHGVAVVISLQAAALIKRGFEVIIGGPKSLNDFPYSGCQRVELYDPMEAVAMAAKLSVDIIIPQTPPFFGVSKWVGEYPRVLCYDHGEPPPDWFPDVEQRKEVLHDKDMSLRMSHSVYAISEAIKAESRTFVTGVIPEGNTHLGQWTQEASVRRDSFRKKLGWENKTIVLNVCRFHSAERFYKGIDTYVDIFKLTKKDQKKELDQLVFVLCGKGTEDDVDSLRKEGLEVFSNVTNDEMFELYCAADLYLNFSKWEGFNLGIAQALAMGLPVLASDIPAHRAFGVDVTSQGDEAVRWLTYKCSEPRKRSPTILSWEPSFDLLAEKIRELKNSLNAH